MAGRITISTLNDDTGVLATQNGMSGIAKAWVNFNGTGTVAIRASMNVSSITDNGSGDYTINFTTAMPDINYSTVGTGGGTGTGFTALIANTNGVGAIVAPTTSSVRVVSSNISSSNPDITYVNVAVFR
jgi:hypothetical protein